MPASVIGRPLSVINKTRDTCVANRCDLALSLWQRVRGLLGRRSLPPGAGLWIDKCSSVHMIGMQFSIDVVYLDAHLRVVSIARDLPPLRINFGGRRARSALELPVGAVDASATAVGDVLEFVPMDTDGSSPEP